MAETPETPAQEPSMEEILASIRKIIADENDPAAPPANGAPATGDEVLELTQMVQDDGSVVDLKSPEPAVAPPQAKEPAKAVAPPPPPRPTPPPPPPPPADRGLISEPAATAAVSSLSSLASTVEIERLSASLPQAGTGLGDGSRTLEDMVIELMRPILKEWLDKNLPAVVDRLVQKEIERISRRAQD